MNLLEGSNPSLSANEAAPHGCRFAFWGPDEARAEGEPYSPVRCQRSAFQVSELVEPLGTTPVTTSGHQAKAAARWNSGMMGTWSASRSSSSLTSATNRWGSTVVRACSASSEKVFPFSVVAVSPPPSAYHRPKSEAPGRLYLGVCGMGQRFKSVETRVFSTLLANDTRRRQVGALARQVALRDASAGLRTARIVADLLATDSG